MAYCTTADIEMRLTEAGHKWAITKSGDVSISASQLATTTSAIVWATNRINAAICNQVEPEKAEASGNAYLKDIAVDLACYRVAGTGGRSVPKTLVDAYTAALDQLDRLQDGAQIPSFDYPAPMNAVRVSRGPRVRNVT